MRWWWLLVPVAACARDEGGAVGDDDDLPTVSDGVAWPDACASAGPDAPAPPPITTPDVVGTFEGFPTYVRVPDPARGLLIYFHGGATSEEVAQVEQNALFGVLYGEGFGVVATQRTAPGPDDNWDFTRDLAANQDASRVERLLAKVRADHGLPDTLPLATVGFSDGAGMSMVMAAIASDEGWPIVASFVHSGAYGNLTGPVPTMFLQPENDLGQAPEPIVDDLLAAGVRAEVVDQPERLAVPSAFLRNGIWDLEKATAAVEDLVSVGMIDASGARLVPDADMERALAAYGSRSPFEGAALSESRLRVLWATHRVSAYSAEEQCRFLIDSL